MDIVLYIVSIGVVIGLAYVALALLQRVRNGGAPRQDLRFVSSLPVGQRERLVIVNWSGKHLLLGVTAASIAVLDQAPAPEGDSAEIPDPQGELGPWRELARRLARAVAGRSAAALARARGGATPVRQLRPMGRGAPQP